MAELVFDHVWKRYPDGTDAVRDLDLAVADGEFMILVGPSGSGKSTALRMAAGLEEITDGALRIDGEVVNRTAPKDRDIAMVFQTYALYPQMTVRENMGFALKLAKVPRAQREAKVREAAEILDLTEHLDRKPASLSGGQRQRVAMGRAIVRAPKVFLMDEPLSNLDAKLRVQMRAAIARIQQRLGTTTIYVTHDQVEAMTLGDRVAVLHGGALQQVGTPKELYHAPVNVFVAGFIGSPPMNFLHTTVTDGLLRLPFGDLQLSQELRSALGRREGEFIAGIRPEQFEDAQVTGVAGSSEIELTTEVELVEDLGAEVLAYFPEPANGNAAVASAVVEGASERAAAPGQMVARLGAASCAARGEQLRLRLCGDGIELFDRQTQKNVRV
jgi:multiple sugar transport system ATP-binding protein